MSRPARNYVRRALKCFAHFGDAEALVATDGRRFTYTEVCSRVVNTAALLWRHGLRPAMTLGVLATNPAESTFVQYAAHLLGCRTVFLSRVAPPQVTRDTLPMVGAHMFVYEVEHMGELGRSVAERAPAMPVLCIGAGGVGPDVVDPPTVTELPFDPEAIAVEPVTLFHTSGTTGTPKLLRHGERFFGAVGSLTSYYRPPDRAMRHLVTSGTWHVAGQSSVLVTLLSGGTVVMTFGFDVGVFLDILVKERITSFNLAPPALYAMLDDARMADVDTSGIWSGTISAGPVAPARLIEAVDRFGPFVDIVYGMSEIPFITALPKITYDPAHPERLASCGRPWGDVRVEIRDPEGGVVPVGEIGEICVASDDLLLEAYVGKDPELTNGRLVDGWLRSGDAGRLDGDGYLYIVGRLHDVVLSTASSELIYCRPIEDALTGHPAVRAAAVIGTPDPVMGEAIHAYVVPVPGAIVTADELRRFMMDTVNEWWTPHRVEFIDALPLNESGKVDKKQLRARHATGAATTA